MVKVMHEGRRLSKLFVYLIFMSQGGVIGWFEQFAVKRITHNDLVPEQLANMRRGPFATPTESEKVEYLMTRVRTDRQRSQFENYGLEHVLSYQRRISATKNHFMRRNRKTPLGIARDFWDRTAGMGCNQISASIDYHACVPV